MTGTLCTILIVLAIIVSMIGYQTAYYLMRRRSIRTPKRGRQRYRSLFEHHPDAIYSLDLEGRYTGANPHALKLIGCTEAGIGELTYESLIAPVDLGKVRRMFHAAREGVPQSQDIDCIRHDGSRFRANVTKLPIFIGKRVVGVYGITQDVSQRHEAQLEFMAHHDALTRLPNRLSLSQRAKAAIDHAGYNGKVLAVLFIDLDRFKAINDSLGHAVGDELLKLAAIRLKSCLRDSDVLARLGGDEFVVMLEDLTRPDDAARVADAVQQAFAPPFDFGDHRLFVSCSIGISCYPQDGDDIEALVKNAAAAMYHSKKYRLDSYHYFSAELADGAVETLRLKNDLHQALSGHAFSLRYQPLFDLRRGRIIGAEALLRWKHPELGIIMPARFIPLAEETGLIVPIGAWVLKNACREAARWRARGHGDLRIAVNLSVRQLTEGDLVRTVEAALAASRLQPRLLELEVTESMMMHDPARARDILCDLHALGVSVAIDDFGTGYSSLNYLKQFPIDSLKIDKSFVESVPTSKDDVAIAQGIIAMSRSLGLRVIAEGVEKPEQFAFVKAEGCDEAQGHLFGQPQTADAFLETLQAGSGALVGVSGRKIEPENIH